MTSAALLRTAAVLALVLGIVLALAFVKAR
jgi:hypothetical protein